MLSCQVHCSWAACGPPYLSLFVGETVRVLPPAVDCQGWVYVCEAARQELRGWAPPSYMAPADIQEY